MKGGSRKLQISVWGLLVVVLLGISGAFIRSRVQQSNLPKYWPVRDFALTNQLGQPVALANLKGKVWVADVIFTLCPGPCARMTEKMAKIQEAFPAGEPLRLVSITTHPEHDTPAVLKGYGERFGADSARWHFLTGSKTELLRNLAMESLKLTALEKEEGARESDNDLFIHSTTFVLVDKAGMVRGSYESDQEGFLEKIRGDIAGLLKESP